MKNGHKDTSVYIFVHLMCMLSSCLGGFPHAFLPLPWRPLAWAPVPRDPKQLELVVAYSKLMQPLQLYGGVLQISQNTAVKGINHASA